MTELVDGRGGKTTIEYNSSNQVVSQTDPMKRITSFEYTAFHTKTTNHATGDVTMQYFTSNGVGTSRHERVRHGKRNDRNHVLTTPPMSC